MWRPILPTNCRARVRNPILGTLRAVELSLRLRSEQADLGLPVGSRGRPATPHFPHSYCDSFQSSAFSLTLLWGEGGRRPDEGALDCRGDVAEQEPRSYFKPAGTSCSRRLHHTPHPPSAPSPLEKHEGRRRSIRKSGDESVRNAGYLATSSCRSCSTLSGTATLTNQDFG
jgi:hypothetical protein